MFELLKTDPSSKARLGRLTTTHGIIDTPVFMPVGTQGSVKALDPRELREMGTEILLGNTYHLSLRPGMDIIRAAGGLHQFINWPHPILTDSGGFQVFSLARIRKIKAHGVEFRSHLDGSLLFLGPREAMCGADSALREECAKTLVALGFDGYAIGGVSVGEPEPEIFKAIEVTEPFLPAHLPRYAMGLGTPAQLVELVARGIDMFDCVLPTRVARNGTAFTRTGAISIKAGAAKADFRTIEDGCECYACRHFGRAYLRHLLNVNEILGLRMVSVHNSHMYLKLMADIRAHIALGTFGEFRREFIGNYVPSRRVLLARANAER